MNKKIRTLESLTFTLTNVNRALVTARGTVPTDGWTEPELGNEHVDDGTTHLDFLATPPRGAAADVISHLEAGCTFFLVGKPREITVHAETNEMRVTLPALGDP